MATVRFCDYTKKRLTSDEETFIVTMGDKEFEVSAEGMALLVAHLEADDLPSVAVVPSLMPAPEPPPAAPTIVAAPGPMINVETTGDPFTPGPGTAPQAEQGEAVAPLEQSDDRPPIQLEIPDNTKKRLGIPSRATYERVIEDATRFEEGTLSALTPGKARKRAGQRLRDVENDQEKTLKRQGGSTININNNYKDAPGYSRGE